jgi:N-acetyl-1-D-myo-inositol-2-amino-2-deoxy-alpha-D-glucopyranoside deacetylase
MEIPRLLFVHAHPDDETLTTGVTIAHYAAQGAQVQVLTCTLGEEGEVIGDRFAQLAVNAADQLGGYRIGELSTALAALGVPGPTFLGGAGRWRDSGMVGTPARRQARFVDADPEEALGELVVVIRDLRPHVVVTYDPQGGYGHPEHIQAHRLTTAAVAAAAEPGGSGASWRVPKLYWTVASRSAARAAADALDGVTLPGHWTRSPVENPYAFDDSEIGAAIHAPASRAAKVAALRAHATQVAVTEDGLACALSNNVAHLIPDTEYFVLAAGAAGERDARGWETDLLAGIALG